MKQKAIRREERQAKKNQQLKTQLAYKVQAMSLFSEALQERVENGTLQLPSDGQGFEEDSSQEQLQVGEDD